MTLVQYRAKTASSAEMYAEALQLKALCDSFNVPLIINDVWILLWRWALQACTWGRTIFPVLWHAGF